jgi:8-oxo-dGTP diphosphatase
MSPANEQINPKDRERYNVIPRVLIFLFNEDSVLLIKGAPDKKLWPGKYNGLGGHIEKGEDTLGAARRELKEESGLHCNSLELCGTVLVDTGGNPGVAIFVFRGEYEGGKIRSSREGDLEWVKLTQIDDFPLVDDLHTILPLIARREPGKPAFSGRYYYDADDQMQIVLSES